MFDPSLSTMTGITLYYMFDKTEYIYMSIMANSLDVP